MPLRMAAAASWPQILTFVMHQRRHFMSTWANVRMPPQYVDVVSPCEESKRNSKGTNPKNGRHQPESWLGYVTNQLICFSISTYDKWASYRQASVLTSVSFSAPVPLERSDGFATFMFSFPWRVRRTESHVQVLAEA